MINKKTITDFIKRWEKRGDEKSDTQSFWLDLLQNIYEVQTPSALIQFERRVKRKNTRFIDAFLRKDDSISPLGLCLPNI